MMALLKRFSALEFFLLRLLLLLLPPLLLLQLLLLLLFIRRPLWGERRCEVAHSTFARRSQG